MSTSTAQTLYSRDVLRLATALPHDDRIGQPHGSATARAPLCGSEISVDVLMNGDMVTALAIRARACALGQASAAVLRDKAPGLTQNAIAAIRAEMAAALTGDGKMPTAWSALSYARDYPARHGAILLPFDALLAAIVEAQKR